MKLSPSRTLALGGAVGIVLVALAALTVFAVGIYRFGWQDKMTSAVARAVPFPAAVVNNNVIRYSDYRDDLVTLERFYAKQRETAGPLAQFPTEEEMKKSVLDRLVRNEIAEELALAFNVAVSAAEIDEEFGKLAAAGSGEDIEKELDELYGWTTAEFKTKVLRPFLILQKLDEAVRNDAEINGKALATAESVLAELRAGGSFEKLAAQHSADTSNAQNGGDLGWFGRGVMVPEFESAAFALGDGEIGGPVKTRFGYHLVRVDDREEENGETVRMSARHILIAATGVEQYLEGEVAKASIKRYVK